MCVCVVTCGRIGKKKVEGRIRGELEREGEREIERGREEKIER